MKAILTSTFLINRVPSKVLQYQTPLSGLLSVFTSSWVHNSLKSRVFGCVVFVHNVQLNRGKFDPKALKCVFLGYSTTQKGYKCYHPSTKRFLISCDVSYVEDQSFCPQFLSRGRIILKETNIRNPISLSPSLWSPYLFLPNLIMSQKTVVM